MDFYKTYEKEISTFKEILTVEDFELLTKVEKEIEKTSSLISTYANNQRGYVEHIRDIHLSIIQDKHYSNIIDIEAAYYYLFSTLLRYSKTFFSNEDMIAIQMSHTTKNIQILNSYLMKKYGNDIVTTTKILGYGTAIYNVATLVVSTHSVELERKKRYRNTFNSTLFY